MHIKRSFSLALKVVCGVVSMYLSSFYKNKQVVLKFVVPIASELSNYKSFNKIGLNLCYLISASNISRNDNLISTRRASTSNTRRNDNLISTRRQSTSFRRRYDNPISTRRTSTSFRRRYDNLISTRRTSTSFRRRNDNHISTRRRSTSFRRRIDV